MVAWFCDDDAGYLAWLRANARGFVVNCAREPSADYLVLHRSDCFTISGRPSRGDTWTTTYAKACGATREELDVWAQARTGASPVPCGHCAP